jgi:hypothetical protein
MKKEFKIETESCNDCPFMQYQFDDFAMGDLETYSCNLLRREHMKSYVSTNKVSHLSYFIKFFKNGNVKSKNKNTLDNCPLLTQDINVSLK